MTNLRSRILIFLCCLSPVAIQAQEQRIASDFEIAAAQRQLSRQRDPLLKMAAHLNLGDLYLTRREVSIAQTHYRSAIDLAETDRLNTRRHSDLTGYATASAYLGVAHAKLGHTAEAFDALEEAMRYAGDSAKLWNLYASSMTLLGKSPKAIAAARRAVTIASNAAGEDPGAGTLLDIAIYKYALASALLAHDGPTTGNSPSTTNEAEAILREVVSSLESPAFSEIRDEIARLEKFEIFSTTRSDAESYLSLMNRARLRLARIYEDRGQIDPARRQLEKVLELRTDDPTALTAMQRLAGGDEERVRYFAYSFGANPFSLQLIDEYEQFVQARRPEAPEGDSVGASIQRAVHHLATGNARAAAALLQDVRQKHPENDLVRFLIARTELQLRGPDATRASIASLRRSPELERRLVELIKRAEEGSRVPSFLEETRTTPVEPAVRDLEQLIRLIQSDQLTPQQRARLDQVVFSAIVNFDPALNVGDTTTFESGTIGSIRFRLQQPTEFRGVFPSTQPWRLDFKILGVTERDGVTVAMIEPLRISAP